MNTRKKINDFIITSKHARKHTKHGRTQACQARKHASTEAHKHGSTQTRQVRKHVNTQSTQFSRLTFKRSAKFESRN